MLFDVSLPSSHLFLFDPQKFRLLIFCKSVSFNSWLHFLSSLTVFCFLFSSTFQLHPLRYLSPASLYSASVCSVPLYLIRLLLSLFRIVLEGFTKTAICQGHRLHFAICCKIKLGDVVYLALFGLPLPSAIFPSHQARHAESVRDGGKRDGER